MWREKKIKKARKRNNKSNTSTRNDFALIAATAASSSSSSSNQTKNKKRRSYYKLEYYTYGFVWFVNFCFFSHFECISECMCWKNTSVAAKQNDKHTLCVCFPLFNEVLIFKLILVFISALRERVCVCVRAASGDISFMFCVHLSCSMFIIAVIAETQFCSLWE